MSTKQRLGIDLSGDHFDLCLVGSKEEPLGITKRFSHDRPGSDAAIDFIEQACKSDPPDELVIGAEATGLLWWHLFHQWDADPTLAEFNPVFYLLNPAQVKGFRKATAPDDKTDQLDAMLISRYLGIDDLLPHPWVNSIDTWSLRLLTRFRCKLAKSLGSLKSYAYNWLYLKASSYVDSKPFANTFGKASLELLRQYPSLDALADMPLDDLAEKIDILGKRRFADPIDNAQKLKEAAQRSYPLDPAVAETVHFILGQLIDIIRFLEKRLKALNSFIAQKVEDDADVNNLRSIGGIGPVYAAGLAVEIRPTERFLDGTKFDAKLGRHRPRTCEDAKAAVAKLAGLWWPRHDSGQLNSQDRRLSKKGNAYLRYYLIEAANHVRGHVAEYGDFYQKKYSEATKHHHRRALVLTARKLARLVFVLLHKHQSYQPRRVANH